MASLKELADFLRQETNAANVYWEIANAMALALESGGSVDDIAKIHAQMTGQALSMQSLFEQRQELLSQLGLSLDEAVQADSAVSQADAERVLVLTKVRAINAENAAITLALMRQTQERLDVLRQAAQEQSSDVYTMDRPSRVRARKLADT